VDYLICARKMFKLKSRSALARNTIWMSIGQGARLIVQALYFTVIARSLGVANYGAFVGVVALVAILYPFGAAGRGNLLVKKVASDKSTFPKMWGAAIGVSMISGLLLISILMVVYHFALPASIPGRLVLLVGASDIIGLNIILIAGQAFQAFERLNWTATINVMISTSRLIGAVLLYSMHHSPTPLQWGYVYFGSTAIVTSAACWLVTKKLGTPQLNLPKTWLELREGLYFSISMSAQTIYNDIDKTMLARLGTLEATGIYGAAYRLIDVSFAPISALLTAAYPHFFRTGSQGIASSWEYAKPHLLRAAVYAILVCLGVLLCAGLVPYFLGLEYARTTEALRWLAPLPLLKALHYFLSDSLTGAGYQWLRSSIQTGVAVFNVLINFWLIPAYSWRGAAWASILSDGLLAASVYVAILCVVRQERLVAAAPETISP
jgi:O-antigen/teichoic acid export membrane protein